MATPAEPAPSVARARLRLRPDLHWSRVDDDLSDRWRVKDPVSLSYHEFGADERFLLEQLNGRQSLDQVRRCYNQQFRPRTITPDKLLQFAADAYKRGLLLSDGDRQAERLRERARNQRRWAGWSRLFSLLFLRLPGIDPEPLLRTLGPATRWLWSPWTMLTVIATAVATLAMLAGNASELATRLPASDSYLQASNAGLLIAAFLLVKVAHELGHGLACRHVGARCHEMGVVLVALMPCLYCDVTDLWMVPSRSKRLLVSAAGMYVELAMAIVCAWLWMFTSDGLASAVLLNVMVACGVSTLVFNANPLLKLDGYYLLSDFAGIPNLHERSQHALWRPIENWFRPTSRRDPKQPLNAALACFAIASLAYRTIVIVLLAWAAHSMLASFHLRPLGDLLVALTAVGLLVGPGYRALALLRSPLARRTFRWARFAAVAFAGLLAGAGLVAVPIPHTVSAPVVFEMQEAQSIAAVVPGRLVTIVAEGDEVQTGQPLARLENPDLTRRRARLASELAYAESNLESLNKRTATEPQLLAELPTARAAVDRLSADLQKLDEEVERLVIRSPAAGTIVASSPRSASESNELPKWQGRATDTANAGCWIEQGDILCLLVPDRTCMQATLMIDAADTRGVRAGLPVRLRADQSVAETLHGEISEVARSDVNRLPPALQRHPDLLTAPTNTSAGPTLDPVLLARVQLSPNALAVQHLSHGRCKIEVASETIGQAIWRWLASAFPLAWF